MSQAVTLNSVHEFVKTFSAEDVKLFADLSEDNNPIHVDTGYAENTIFKKRVVHGVLLTSMFSKIFGTIYPGEGGIYLAQSSKFLKPAFLDEEITARVTLTEFDNTRKRGVFKTECFKNADVLILTGEAKILFPSHFSL